VPFRDSKLTLLLSEYLRTARTFLVATASPAASSVEETMATLRLAQAVRQITTRSRRSEASSKATSATTSPAQSLRTPRAPGSMTARAGQETPKLKGAGYAVASSDAACPTSTAAAKGSLKAEVDAETPDRFHIRRGASLDGAARGLLQRTSGASVGGVPVLLGKDLEACPPKSRQWRSSDGSVSSQGTRLPGSKSATETTTDSDHCSEDSGPARIEAALQRG